jgi:hypothetical protein
MNGPLRSAAGRERLAKLLEKAFAEASKLSNDYD